jgi:hypothetical protein
LPNTTSATVTCKPEDLPRRIFLDSCTAQVIGDYGGHIFEGEPIADSDRLHRMKDGIANAEALQSIFFINQRALFEWIVSHGSMREAHDKCDPRHMRWMWDIADHTEVCLENDGSSEESQALAARLDDRKFGYLSVKDRALLQEAVFLRCDAFLTVERRLPKNANHIAREVGIRILTPIQYWEMLRPMGWSVVLAGSA